MMKQLLFSILLFLSFVSTAQTVMNRDSLLRLMPAIKEDSAGVEFYINLGQQYEANEPELAKYYYRKAGTISEKINYEAGVVRYIFNYTFVLNLQARYDSGLLLNQQSVAIARTLNDPVLLGKALFNTGTSYRQLARYAEAAKFYEEGRKLFADNGDSFLSAQGYDILQLMYFNIEDYDKAIEYGQAAVKYLRTVDEPMWLGTALNNLGLSYIKKRKFNEAEQVYNETLKISKRIAHVEMESSAMLNMADVFLQKGEYEKLKPFYEKAVVLNKQLQSDDGLVISYRGMAIYYFFRKEFETAKAYALQSYTIADTNNLRMEKQQTMQTLSRIYFALHDMKSGYAYLRAADVLADSILSDKIRRNALDLEAKYQSQQKILRIQRLEDDKKIQQLTISRKNTLNYILIGSAASLLIISLLSYRNYRHKQKLQQQRINELETEKQLAATEAVLKGEEQERTRLAKDLHDGLGGMLSGIKYSFNTMKGNLILTPDNAQAFERSMDMLDSSIKEMRRVAHNMMPEALVKFGLDTALKDFCNDINASGALKVSYQSLNIEEVEFEQSTAITIYRIVQELINNTMKHAVAKNAIVQLSKTDDAITITVEDDGKGFDADILKAARGIGWTNILSRIEYLKGKLDVRSEAGKGTSVHIELNA
ncbi:tetratricopeptide repeat protein [Lacibacter luteus]|uniref:Tetratricopeptide repeat protein n=1 Tax=Lacibacter luteus TaxID=2508719 RepID=A0A4Q1CM62_9BACT|nr:tetratricopeptide repeat protein [Lacibacter luteus]RXK62106.1 tetratricopeptide repeat protein [Lacibacter luteus]